MSRIRSSPIVVLIFVFVAVVWGKQCNTEDLVNEQSQCSKNETCTETNATSVLGECKCNRGYRRVSEVSCVLASSDTPVEETSHLAVGILIPLFIVLVIVALYYSHKHQLLVWLRYKLNQRYNNNYDDVMIGQDDD